MTRRVYAQKRIVLPHFLYCCDTMASGTAMREVFSSENRSYGKARVTKAQVRLADFGRLPVHFRLFKVYLATRYGLFPGRNNTGILGQKDSKRLYLRKPLFCPLLSLPPYFHAKPTGWRF
jgi:hypothetical protein